MISRKEVIKIIYGITEASSRAKTITEPYQRTLHLSTRNSNVFGVLIELSVSGTRGINVFNIQKMYLQFGTFSLIYILKIY